MPAPVQIPADVDREDRILGELTGRQVIILLVAALAAYAVWALTGPTRLAWFAVASIPIGVVAVALAFGRRDGVALDRLLLAALTQRLQTPTRPDPDPEPDSEPDGRMVPGGRGRSVISRVPVRGVHAVATGPSGLGVLDLGGHGLAVVCSVTPINLALRSEPEQDAAIAGLARWLHSLTAPVQILSRTRPLDLDTVITGLRHHAHAAAHPALAAAAYDHAEHLAALAAHADLTTHEYLLVFREPRPAPRTGEDRAASPGYPASRDGDRSPGRVGRRPARAAIETLARRAGEAAALLGPLGLRVTVLDAPAAARAVHAATHPGAEFPTPATPRPLPPRARPVPPHRPASPHPPPQPPLLSSSQRRPSVARREPGACPSMPHRAGRSGEPRGGRGWGVDTEAPTLEFDLARTPAPLPVGHPPGHPAVSPPDDEDLEADNLANDLADDIADDLADDIDGGSYGDPGGVAWREPRVGPLGISEVLDGPATGRAATTRRADSATSLTGAGGAATSDAVRGWRR